MPEGRGRPGTEAFSLAGTTSAVTGAGSGLGRSIAHALAGSGSHVACLDVSVPSTEAVATDIRAEGGSATGMAVDVTDGAAVGAAVAGLMADRGRLDVMCNVAGVPGDGALVEDIDVAEFDRIFAVHFKGTLFGCQAAVKAMAPAGRGSIINMVSTAIDTPRSGLGTYTASKFAIAGLTKVLAVEAGAHGIRVNAVAPGFVETPLSLARMLTADREIDTVQRDEMVQAMSAMSPLGRPGEPEDVALLCLFLASDASRFVTGQTLRPNGGASMPF